MTGVAEGLARRFVGLAARLGLLVAVLPGLAPGEVTRYLLLTTAATLLGRLLCLGLDDELPLVVRGDVATARSLHRVSLYPLLGGVALGGAALAAGAGSSDALAVVCAALVLAGTLVLIGLLRTLSPALYEWVINAPPVLLLGGAACMPAIDGQGLVLLGAGAQALVALGAGVAAGLLQRRPAAPAVALRSRLSGGVHKLAASLLLIAQVRALGWLPSAVGDAAADALTYAVLVGEAGLQLANVAVQRHYGAYARGEGSPRLAARRGATAWAALAAAAALLVGLPLPAVSWLDPAAAAWALVAAGALAATLEVRYFCWSRGLDARPHLGLQAAWLLVVTLVVVALPAPRWPAAAAAGTSLLAGAALAWLALGDRFRCWRAG
ncbi:MAG: hypothetical protein KF878_10020 [Planctomycetes bacterium]|nr:hypothetical protein [Planctomycetota bacterium]